MGIRLLTEMQWKSAGFVWFVTVVLTVNVVYVMRNRTPWARKAADVMRRFSVRREDASLLVWAIIGDVLLLVCLIAFIGGS
jgi:hypothetical protein